MTDTKRSYVVEISRTFVIQTKNGKEAIDLAYDDLHDLLQDGMFREVFTAKARMFHSKEWIEVQ